MWELPLGAKRKRMSWPRRVVLSGVKPRTQAFARRAHSIVCRAQDHVQRFETIAGRSAMVRSKKHASALRLV